MTSKTLTPRPPKPGPPFPDDDLLEDGQEEVASRTAVEHGLVKDPRAMGPARRDPGDLDD